ncbi:MAG: nuclear transport factor 2 family protein [Pseudomonadota bacterium]|nr:nuclear transport factor 2 family protein [Pseudomonadota bacterium]
MGTAGVSAHRAKSFVHYNSGQPSFIAKQFCDAWVTNNGKFNESWFSDGFRFVTPYVTYTGFAEFDSYFEEILPNFLEVDIAHEFHNEEYYAWVFDITFADPYMTLRVAQLMTFENNEITEIEWIFDPREVYFRFNV